MGARKSQRQGDWRVKWASEPRWGSSVVAGRGLWESLAVSWRRWVGSMWESINKGSCLLDWQSAWGQFLVVFRSPGAKWGSSKTLAWTALGLSVQKAEGVSDWRFQVLFGYLELAIMETLRFSSEGTNVWKSALGHQWWRLPLGHRWEDLKVLAIGLL